MTQPDVAQTQFHVVVNHEEQYSLWPARKPLPPGWKPTFGPDEREACLAHIRAVWTDLRPLSLRKSMAGAAEK